MIVVEIEKVPPGLYLQQIFSGIPAVFSRKSICVKSSRLIVAPSFLARTNSSAGVGVPYTPDKEPNDILAIGEGVRKVYEEILVPAGMGDVALYTELGRFMLAPYGHLITTAIHEKHTHKEYIGVDACAVNLMRPAMYGAYHHITVLGKRMNHDHKYDVTGSLCENNDKFAIDRICGRMVHSLYQEL